MNHQKSKRKTKSLKPETVLIAVTGMSPAIITETIWALAHEKPAILPAKIVAFATTRSREQVRKELLDSGVWAQLRRHLKVGPDLLTFGDTSEHIRVFTRGSQELCDLLTPQDNIAAADFILQHLRQFTENPDVHIVASIAGGRKTMSALLYACMTLIGRETDRITHVLVDEELERRQNPKFYYPKNKSEAAGIHLADISFVPLRNAFESLGRMPGHFEFLVQRYTRELQGDKPVEISLEPDRVTIAGVEVALSKRERLLLEFLLDINQRGVPYFTQTEARDELRTFASTKASTKDDKALKLCDTDEDLRHTLSTLRKKLRSQQTRWAPGIRQAWFKLPPFRLKKTTAPASLSS